MVDEEFHDFFLGAASAVGALIGLLFVAISVAPKALTGKAEHHREGFKAATAMSIFLDALVVSMLALVPGVHLGIGSAIMATVGILSTLALVVIGVRAGIAHEPPGKVARSALQTAGLLALYVVQLVSALSLRNTPADAGQVRTHAVLVVIMFVVGIGRAWELVGANSPRLLSTLAHPPRKAAPAAQDGPGPGDAAAP